MDKSGPDMMLIIGFHVSPSIAHIHIFILTLVALFFSIGVDKSGVDIMLMIGFRVVLRAYFET